MSSQAPWWAFGPLALQLRTPSPNPPSPTPLPPKITRTYIPTSSGPLELLHGPLGDNRRGPPSLRMASTPALLFLHGGFGCAEIWLQYLVNFSGMGYRCYAVSLRGHGKSWHPSFWEMYFTTRGQLAGDVVDAVKWVEQKERELMGHESEGSVVLIAHSAGAALSQYVLSTGLCRVRGFAMVAGVPGFGSFSCYSFWAKTALFHFTYRLFHPRYILATTSQIRAAFFLPSASDETVKWLEQRLSPYESMLWPMQGLFAFVTGPDVLRSITGWTSPEPKRGELEDESHIRDSVLVLAAEKDVLVRPEIAKDAALRYQRALLDVESSDRSEGLDGDGERKEKVKKGIRDLERGVGLRGSGVRFVVLSGATHHFMNEKENGKGMVELLYWVEQL
ncbi:alpha/beta-hydrolase [Sporormia fimetaria CBS 119925]|uniref:Alpha/beta-hydrolase n=1 Tax=Sporormia fimetaria CBS 119925 TaxID=1340428 RepID=A0A6A6VFP7_9PLEO|nr:alpha/beta-hydrolase [Sporormia fimetaria CBS 119925]